MRHTARHLAGTFLLVSILALPGVAGDRDLTFEQRVAAQAAIERVYQRHRSGDSKPTLPPLSRPALEDKVRDYLARSVALERRWSAPITEEALRREAERIARDTRFPARLREIRRALGNEPFLYLECFVRPVLAQRLSRARFAGDRSIHHAARAEAASIRNALLEGRLSADAEHPRRFLRDRGPGEQRETGPLFRSPPGAAGQPVTMREEPDRFVVEVAPAREDDPITTYAVPKVRWDDWWTSSESSFPIADFDAVAPAAAAAADLTEPVPASACHEDDVWNPGRFGMTPESRLGHTAVWTGSEMIVWGGYDGMEPNSNGGRYDPLTDTWTPIATAGAPAPRLFHTAVWTGTEMIVWGGENLASISFDDGGRYDPAADAWTPVSVVGTAGPRTLHTAVWTGTRMLVWGGFDYATGYAVGGGSYDPVTDTWSPLSTVGEPSPRRDHVAVWTGSLMLIWGSEADGGRYDPSTDTWSPMAGGAGSPSDATGVWTGTEMIVFGGGSAGRYDPATDTWAPVSAVNRPEDRFDHVAVWTGSEMIVWGGVRAGAGGTGLVTGGRYDPATDTWTPTTTAGVPDNREWFTGVWTGDRMIVWGGWRLQPFLWALNTGGLYDPASDSWAPTSAGLPAARRSFDGVWTGAEVLFWGGTQDSGVFLDSGSRYDPLLDDWQPTATAGAPPGRAGHSAVWTGSEMIVWGGEDDTDDLDTGGRYDPASDSWSPMTASGAPVPRTGHTAVWAGDAMLVWGGADGSSVLGSGGRYDPAADSWTPISTVGAPSPRELHTAVWADGEMIVWGGWNRSSYFGDGARYDPVSDSWTPTANVPQTPSARSRHVSVWTGLKMVVWGGYDGTAVLETGGRYDPATDQWQSTKVAGAPTDVLGRAVWTGGEMLVWPGSGRYDPATDGWTSMTSEGEPGRRSRPLAVWAEGFLAVWGGERRDAVSSGGRYFAGGPADYDGDTYTCDVDCDDGSTAFHPGAIEICDGLDNDCDGVVPPDEVDGDSDGWPLCNDCDDGEPARFPGNPEVCDGLDNDCDGTADSFATACGLGACAAEGFCTGGADSCTPGTPSPEVCDGLDNDCDGTVPADEADGDGDGFRMCVDCNDGQPSTYPGAVETNDGLDNQCPGEPGFGLVDELSSVAGFPDAGHFCWEPQPGAIQYEVRLADDPGFASACEALRTAASCVDISDVPSPGGVRYALARAADPFAGSAGSGEGGLERTLACGGEWVCDDGLDDDLDGLADCADLEDCFGIAGCTDATLTFLDTVGDDLATTALESFLADLAPAPGDHLYAAWTGPGLIDFELCLGRADFYAAQYLALAPTLGTALSGDWDRWYREGGGAWAGPVAAGHDNWFGAYCTSAYSWCVEVGLGGRIPAVAPAETGICEAFENVTCSDGTWTVTLRVGIDRFSACGF